MRAGQFRRRDFIALLGGAAVAWPDVARAQQPAMPAIGFLSTGPAASFASTLAAFHRGLNDNGYVDGQNVKIEYRWVEGRYDQLPALAAELVQRQVSVIGRFMMLFPARRSLVAFPPY